MGELNVNEMLTIEEYITNHCSVSMENAIAAERFPLWKRSCDAIDDETICHSSYFNALKSARDELTW